MVQEGFLREGLSRRKRKEKEKKAKKDEESSASTQSTSKKVSSEEDKESSHHKNHHRKKTSHHHHSSGDSHHHNDSEKHNKKDHHDHKNHHKSHSSKHKHSKHDKHSSHHENHSKHHSKHHKKHGKHIYASPSLEDDPYPLCLSTCTKISNQYNTLKNDADLDPVDIKQLQTIDINTNDNPIAQTKRLISQLMGVKRNKLMMLSSQSTSPVLQASADGQTDLNPDVTKKLNNYNITEQAIMDKLVLLNKNTKN